MQSLRDDKPYLSMLHTLSEVAQDALASPLSDEEIATLHDRYICRTPLLPAIKAIALEVDAQDFPSDTRAAMAALTTGRLVRAYREHAVSHEFAIENVLSRQAAAGLPVGIGQTATMLGHREGDYTWFAPDFEVGMRYWAAKSIITSRLQSEETQLQVALAVAGSDLEENPYDKLVRVIRRPHDVHPKRQMINTFVEGYESVFYSGFHLETGGAAGISERPEFASAVAEYARALPHSGMLGPMALHGKFWPGLFEPDGTITPAYKTIFEAIKAEEVADITRKRTPDPRTRLIEPEPNLNQADFIGLTSDEQAIINFDGFPASEVLMMDDEAIYAGQGCPAVSRIVRTAAATFQNVLMQVREADLPEVPAVDFEPHLWRYRRDAQ